MLKKYSRIACGIPLALGKGLGKRLDRNPDRWLPVSLWNRRASGKCVLQNRLLPTFFWLATAAAALAQAGNEPQRSTHVDHAPLRPAARLGVVIGPVPRAVAVHIGLEGEAEHLGLIIHNVRVGSSADKAGLERDDVIVAVDDRPVLRTIVAFVQAIAHYKSDDTIPLTIIRRGQKQNLDLQLGKPTKQDKSEYKYPKPPHTVVTGKRIHKIWERDRAGEWHERESTSFFEDLPRELRDKLHELMEFDPQHHRAFSIRRNVRGRDIRIERDGQGRITVTDFAKDDTGEDQIVRTKTYESPQELLSDSPEVFRMYLGASLAADGVAPGNPEDRRRWLRELREHYRKHFRERRAPRSHKPPPHNSLPPLATQHHRRPPPRFHFQVDEQGQILVEVQHGTDRLSFTFKNEEELKSRHPGFYRRYQEMTQDEGAE